MQNVQQQYDELSKAIVPLLPFHNNLALASECSVFANEHLFEQHEVK